MKVKDVLPILSTERTLWIEDQNFRSVDVGAPDRLRPETLEREIDILYPDKVPVLGGFSVICIRVKEIEDGQ